VTGQRAEIASFWLLWLSTNHSWGQRHRAGRGVGASRRLFLCGL